MGGTGRTLLHLSTSTNLFANSIFSSSKRLPLHKLSFPPRRVLVGFRPLCSSAVTTTATSDVEGNTAAQPAKHSILLEKLRLRHLKESGKISQINAPPSAPTRFVNRVGIENNESESESKRSKKKGSTPAIVSSFQELGLNEEVINALEEMRISVPTEIQCIGIPAVLEGKSVVLGSHTGSGKTLAYMLPIVQLLRRDEADFGILMKPRRPRAVILSPTRELSEQVFRIAKAISHHARFRSTMVSGGGRLRPQEDSLNIPVDMVVGTPGRILQHIEDGNLVYGDIRYLVLDEADTMFDRGFGPDIRKFLGPLKNRSSKPGDTGFQTVLVAATMTKAVQNLVDEEFEGIVHLRTSTLHKKIASARHDFIKLSGSENKLESLMQVLEPSLAKGNRVMVFCNTLDSSRAVDHYLSENNIYTVNYHGEVPAEKRVENLKKFKSQDGDCPTLVCTDLAARGLDLDVDHVVMFDFPLNSVDYLHRTGRTARMGAKGKVTSLVVKRSLALATRIEEAIMKNESLELLSVDGIHRDAARSRILQQKEKNTKVTKAWSKKSNSRNVTVRSSSGVQGKGTPAQTLPKKSTSKKPGKAPAQFKSKAAPAQFKSKPGKAPAQAKSKLGKAPETKYKKGVKVSKSSGGSSSKRSAKISVVGFRGRNSSGKGYAGST